MWNGIACLGGGASEDGCEVGRLRQVDGLRGRQVRGRWLLRLHVDAVLGERGVERAHRVRFLCW